MRLVIETYWNKVVDDPKAHFGRRVVKDEYVRKDYTSYPNGGGWKSKREWKKSVKKRHGFMGFVDEDKAKFHLSNHYGIHSYQLVYMKEE